MERLTVCVCMCVSQNVWVLRCMCACKCMHECIYLERERDEYKLCVCVCEYNFFCICVLERLGEKGCLQSLDGPFDVWGRLLSLCACAEVGRHTQTHTHMSVKCVEVKSSFLCFRSGGLTLLKKITGPQSSSFSPKSHLSCRHSHAHARTNTHVR